MRQIRYLSQEDVAAVGLTPREVLALVELSFRERAAERAEMPAKIGIHPSADAFLHAMPAFLPALGLCGMKWVSAYPGNPRRGLPAVGGLVLLNDPETGLPLAVMDAAWITAKRTAASSTLAARYLARPDSKRLGILGCGVQARSHVEALSCTFPIREVRGYDPDEKARDQFAAEVEERFHVHVTAVASPKEAVSGSDLVVTAGPILRKPHATIQPGWLEAGAFASLVDFDTSWDRRALREVDKFCTDDLMQLEHYKVLGYFRNVPAVHAELGDLVTGKRPGRETASERTVACNLGLAVEDVVVAGEVLCRAVEQGIGTELPI
jgi:ornithine cyclodeaminase/alanine dehydrogenase-like protein (mu-crystallin family)